MTFGAIAGFRLVTQDPCRLTRFYAALGFAIDDPRPISAAELTLLGIAGGGTRWPMRLGAARVELDWFDRPGCPYPSEADAASRCFHHLALVTDDVAIAWDIASAAGASPIGSDRPVTLPASSGGVTAIKFRDPEGHPLELIRFPDGADKGWKGQGVLGIDHSAVVVADVDASIPFYAGQGLGHGEATLNHGPTQAALDGLDGALVDVVPMMPACAPSHVELLHYRTPARHLDRTWSPTDVAATRMVWRGDGPALLRDPDGHLHQVGG